MVGSSNHVVTFASQKKHVLVEEHKVLDQETIYARVIGLLVSSRDLNLPQVLSTHLPCFIQMEAVDWRRANLC